LLVTVTPNVQALANMNQRNLFSLRKQCHRLKNHIPWENMLGWALFLTKATFAVDYMCTSEKVSLLIVKA